ncbi:Copper homeostasis protein cutC like protein [Cladophialophora carrionii]|uniref:Copper homeostasis protein cutC homolog n=1 Tax=Cladophialophora carrionii TaxID=86049 RepID=A0A1C1CVS0_9EURO|nr:Copper homeostasis protein cutC like protein [Cladophialophora carrionii]
MTLLEVACFNVQSAIVANEAGADRIELCDNADLGGTTPPLRWLDEIHGIVKIPINVMIRPRGGDFVYTDPEFQIMKDAINVFKSTGMVSGFVFGVLKHDRTVDVERTAELVRLADPLPCTFHRAFDETTDLDQALEDVLGCGIHSILTSGGASKAIHARETLARLVKKADGRVVVMPGGGVRSTNIGALKESTNASAYHSSALLGSNMVANAQEIEQMEIESR